MAVNHYFQGGLGIGSDAEKRLHEDVIIESLKIFGQDIYYLPRTLVNRDLVLGEDTSSRFDDSYLLEMYFERKLSSELLIKFKAIKCASLLREAMWSMVSEITSDIEFDYESYTSENLSKFNQAFNEEFK